MPTYRKYNWSELIQNFKNSGLTQTQFCKDNNLNPKYFNQKLRRFELEQRPASGFASVVVEAESCSGLTLTIGQCDIRCPANMSLSTVAQLAKLLQ